MRWLLFPASSNLYTASLPSLPSPRLAFPAADGNPLAFGPHPCCCALLSMIVVPCYTRTCACACASHTALFQHHLPTHLWLCVAAEHQPCEQPAVEPVAEGCWPHLMAGTLHQSRYGSNLFCVGASITRIHRDTRRTQPARHSFQACLQTAAAWFSAACHVQQLLMPPVQARRSHCICWQPHHPPQHNQLPRNPSERHRVMWAAPAGTRCCWLCTAAAAGQ
jgi:hypothetical protein